jgi:hypothetical protein
MSRARARPRSRPSAGRQHCSKACVRMIQQQSEAKRAMHLPLFPPFRSGPPLPNVSYFSLPPQLFVYSICHMLDDAGDGGETHERRSSDGV